MGISDVWLQTFGIPENLRRSLVNWSRHQGTKAHWCSGSPGSTGRAQNASGFAADRLDAEGSAASPSSAEGNSDTHRRRMWRLSGRDAP
jgi:hypothetical protein